MYNIQNSNEIYVSEKNVNTVTIEKVEDLNVTKKSMLGLSLGTGVQYQLNYRNYISSEIRYSRFFNTKDFLGIDQIQLILSFSF
jgi:opacity protein-like surface antigen